MDKTTILENEYQINVKPNPQTIQNILNFSRSYHCAELKSGLSFEMIQN